MRIPHLLIAMLLSTMAWAQLPFSFSGSAGGDCTPQIHNEPWPGTTVPNNAVRFDWSAINTTADPIPMQVFVYRNTYGTGGGGFVTEQILHAFTITAAPNTTTTGVDFWPCASTQFEVNRGHSVRVAGPNGTCTAFSMTVSLVAPAFANDAEGNNSFGTGALITTATDNDGHLRFNGATDDDWYRIQLPAQGKLVITLQSETPADVASTLLADLYYTSGTYINGLSASTGTNNVPNTNVFEQTCRGGSTITYYLRLRALGGCDVSYRLTVSVVTPVFGIDPVADNTLVAYNTYQDGQQQFDSPNDNSDLFAIAPPFNGVMSIEVQAEHAGPEQSTMQVRLLYSSGAVVQTWNVPSGANGVPITTVVSIPCRGTSPFQRISFQSATCGASYRFKYTVAQPLFTNDAEPNNSSGQAYILPEGQTAQGQVNFADDDNTDSYRVNLSSDGKMHMTIEAEHVEATTTGTITVALYLSTGTILETWTAPVGANSTPISTTLSKTCRGNAGNYYMQVSSSVCGTSYRISYAVTPPFFAQDAEPNNSTSQAIVLPEGQSAQGHLNFFFGDNGDTYRANLSGDGVMNVNIEAEHADASVTGIITVQLSVSTGTVLQTWTAPVGANSLAIGTALSKTCRGNAPNYYLTVSSDVCGTSYRISYSVTPPFYANDPEPNNSTPGTPMDLNAANQQGHIGFYNTTDDDYYAFTHPGGPWSIMVSAEHADAGEGSMSLVVINNPGTVFGTFTVPVGGSSTALTNTFTIPSLPAGTIYRVRLSDITCGVSYRIHCYDTDNDGTCNAFDLCAGGPEPGTPCNDNSACTTNDVIQANCTCAGTAVDPNDNNPCTLDSCDPITGVSNVFQDADADGTCDANDLCPGGPEPGTACNDNNACTTGDVIGTNCLCAGTFADADADGTCDANDLCPGGPEPGTACNDNNGATINDIIQANCLCGGTLLGNDCEGVPGGPAVPGTACNDNNACTTGDVYGVNCLCAGTFADADADGTCDANDLCPGGPEPGTACDDGNAATTNDMITATCTCAGVPTGGCDHELTLELQTDGAPNEVTWEIRSEDGNSVIASGGPLVAPNGVQTNFACLNDGCFTLRVLDSASDGMTNGGYILRTTGTNERIIDNRNNFSSGSVSAISAGQGFCLPLSNDKLLFTSCDKLDWISGQYVVAAPNTAVSAEWIPNGANNVQDANSGYEFWIFDPNGSYSFRRFRNHATSDGFGPASATRACHMKLNNWAVANQVPANRLMNVRVRTRVNGVSGAFGPACRLAINPTLAACPQTQLMNIPGDPDFSCGATRMWGTGNLVHARPVSGANRYQFRFRIPAEGFSVTRTVTTYFTQLNWSVLPLQDGKTYDVDVRVSKDGGATWCSTSDPWGPVCQLTIDNTPANSGNQNFAIEATAAELRMFPNPNRGDQLNFSISAIEEGVNTVSVDIYDLTGKRMSARMIAVADGKVNTVIDLNGELAAGMYLVNITAGENTYTERLVIQP
ncbi:MAG: T9SS type A sorting domain-containing protein [Flavobacteriales bacterium]|nr:T9SS type A sorting domain-containing protein [Flavobacteriales bacterium]